MMVTKIRMDESETRSHGENYAVRERAACAQRRRRSGARISSPARAHCAHMELGLGEAQAGVRSHHCTREAYLRAPTPELSVRQTAMPVSEALHLHDRMQIKPNLAECSSADSRSAGGSCRGRLARCCRRQKKATDRQRD
jgi:hypothetical protein